MLVEFLVKKKVLFCVVQKIKELDIPLLYQNLVVLPQDKAMLTPENTKREEEITPAKQPEKETLPTEASEPKGTYTPKQAIPFIILIPEHLKADYMAETSAFYKILAALNISTASKYVSSNLELLNETDTYSCIWCVGLDLANEKKAMQSGHKNILLSPDIHNLTTKEEKKAMYTPLKQFVQDNLEHINKI